MLSRQEALKLCRPPESAEFPLLKLSRPFVTQNTENGSPKTEHAPTKPLEVAEVAQLAQNHPAIDALRIRDARGVGFWYYKGCDVPCTICLQPLMSLCPQCEYKSPDGCMILEGKCHHFVHKHCLKEYQNSQLCLVCRQPWTVEAEHIIQYYLTRNKSD